ncbi:Aldehyde dehydrogenase family protein [Phycisphaerae bacterium RAS1]|nr:Aldehyde dehydrogenase family protein [Phycisphaerae bacterium RAS1]
MIHIPLLRRGTPYESVEKTTLVHHATGEPIASLSLANSGLLVRDIHQLDDTILERFSTADLIARCKRAAELFATAALPLGDAAQSFDDYVRCLSATTGMPVTYCHTNAGKIRHVMANINTVLAGLTRGLDLEILDRGHGVTEGRTVSFYREGRIFGAVLPSNSPGVHALWIPAVVLKAPIVLKPGREEPWTPLRIIAALIAAGFPAEAFGFYPTDHAGAGELLRSVDRAMLFGDASTTRPYANDRRIELHGPGYSKVILGPDAADEWERHIDVMVSSISANAGRSCINASAVWTPRHGRKIADALAARLAKVEALPADDGRAEIAAFANADMAERISLTIDAGLREPGAADLTEALRGSRRLVKRGRCAWLLPTIIWIDPAAGSAAPRAADEPHPLANREFLFPFASVVERPAKHIPGEIGSSLVVTAITRDKRFIEALMASANVDRLNIGPIPTWQLAWDQPHEGNLFELLYHQRAFQSREVA